MITTETALTERQQAKLNFQSAEEAYQTALSGYMNHAYTYEQLKTLERAKVKAYKTLAAIIKKAIR
jgi:hypothetical protein